MATEKKIPTKMQPCSEDPEYDNYQCLESYFYSKRGCQYPWNTYKNLDLAKCRNYTAITNMIKSVDPNMGYKREMFAPSQRLAITKCPPPCFLTHYNIKFEGWTMHGSNVSLQIAFADFMITHKEEYLACDTTCILGQLGGNIGLFLGGSILLGLDMLMEYVARTYTFIYQKWRKI